MKCPKCFAVLQQVEIYDQTYVHSCPKCSGAFYTEDELSVPLNLEAVKSGKWPCPSCSSAMETGTVCDGKIELDRCTDCGGFWFDAGELESLSQLEHVQQITKHVGAIGDFDEDQPEREPWWHAAVHFLVKPAESK